jgi:hypothetical protein
MIRAIGAECFCAADYGHYIWVNVLAPGRVCHFSLSSFSCNSFLPVGMFTVICLVFQMNLFF